MKAVSISMLVNILLFLVCTDTPTNKQDNNNDDDPIFEEKELEFYTIDQGMNGAKNKGQIVIKSESEYRNHFNTGSGGFDFNNDMIVVTYKGEIALSGHKYEIITFMEKEDVIEVTINFESCYECNTSYSAPFHIVGLTKKTKDFTFKETLIE